MNVVDEPVRRILINEAKSHFCVGNFVEGMWTRDDANCKDEIHTTAIDGRSDYITVKVDPVSVRAGLVSADTVGKPSSRSTLTSVSRRRVAVEEVRPVAPVAPREKRILTKVVPTNQYDR